MRLVFVGILALALGACNETVDQAGPGPLTADAAMQDLPPIYEPIVDMNRVKEAKYRGDLAFCRRLAAPQERIARAAAQQAQVGAAIALAGDVVGAIPGSRFKEARTLGATSNALEKIGGVNVAQGVSTSNAALNDYVLVVNTCLRHHRYILLR